MTSTVCMIARNEGPYLAEWVAHYLALGFDEIVIYDNKSTDGSGVMLDRLAQAGFIVLRPWTKGAEESPQLSAYADAVTQIGTEWVFFADADELLVLHHHASVNDFLAGFAPEVSTVAVNWRLFGDSHQASPDGRLLRERFTWAAVKAKQQVKSFSRVRDLGDLVNMHACETKGAMVHASGAPLTMAVWGKSDGKELHIAQVNHYYTKTYAEYQDKVRRGRAGVAETHELKYTSYGDAAFHQHNHNEVEDRSIDIHRAAFDRVYPAVLAVAQGRSHYGTGRPAALFRQVKAVLTAGLFRTEASRAGSRTANRG